VDPYLPKSAKNQFEADTIRTYDLQIRNLLSYETMVYHAVSRCHKTSG